MNFLQNPFTYYLGMIDKSAVQQQINTSYTFYDYAKLYEANTEFSGVSKVPFSSIAHQIDSS